MNRSFWLTLLISGFACTAVLIFQTGRNRSLAHKLAEESASPAQLKQDQRLTTATSNIGSAMPGNVEAAIKETKQTERIARTLSRIDLLVADLGNIENNAAAFFRILPDLLRLIKDLSLDELIAVAQGIDAPFKNGSNDGKSITKMVLILIAAEQEPARILKVQEFMENSEMKMGVLGALARQDPDAAQRWLKNADIASNENSQLQAILLAQTMRRDVYAGLKLFMEMPVEERGDSAFYGTMPVPMEQVPELIEAIKKPEFTEIKEQITGMILSSTLMDGGIAAVRALDLEPDDLKNHITLLSWQTMQSEPTETLEWMSDALPKDQQSEAIPKAINLWAKWDFNAAGEYLGNMPPSPIRDQSILQFSQTIADVDPESAAIWTLEIEEPDTRTNAIRNVVSQWNTKDQSAADKWLQKNDINPDSLKAPE